MTKNYPKNNEKKMRFIVDKIKKVSKGINTK